MVHMTEAIVADAKGDYFVGITDLHPGADGLVSLRGPENLCLDLYDHMEAIKKSCFFNYYQLFKHNWIHSILLHPII